MAAVSSIESKMKNVTSELSEIEVIGSILDGKLDFNALSFWMDIRELLARGDRPMISFIYEKATSNSRRDAKKNYDTPIGVSNANAHLLLVTKFENSLNGPKISGNDFFRPDENRGAPHSYRQFFLSGIKSVKLSGTMGPPKNNESNS